MKNNKLITKILAVFILLMSGVSICVAQDCPPCPNGSITVVAEMINGEGATGINPHQQYEIGAGSVCVVEIGINEWAIYDEKGMGPCGGICGCWAGKASFPLTDASFLLVFLLGAYSIYLYRRRRVANKT